MKSASDALRVFVAFALALLLFSMAASVANAHTPPWQIPTYAYLQVFPNPIGKGQPVWIWGWLDKYPPTANGEYGDRWENITVTVMKPDGNIETLKVDKSDPVGTIFILYTPDQVGTYKFQMHFPGQVLMGKNPPLLNAIYVGDYFKPSDSNIVEVTVQATPIPEYMPPPLPTGFWKRPISQENEGWGQIAGNWIGITPAIGRVNPYMKAPESAHVVWTKPITFGGIVGGQLNDVGYYTGISYEGYWSPPLIMFGRLYYNQRTPPRYGFYCVDLQTGEQIWWKNSTGKTKYTGGFYAEYYSGLSYGYIYDYESPNQHGALAYLVETDTTNWYILDAFTGNWILTIKNVPSGMVSYAKDGSILIYQYNSPNRWLACWNLSRAIWYRDTFPGNMYWMWRPLLGGTIDAKVGYSWNITLPKEVPSGMTLTFVEAQSQVATLTTSGVYPAFGQWVPSIDPYYECAISLKPGEQGKLLWIKQRSWPPGNVTMRPGPAGEGVYTVYIKETMQWLCYSLDTGELLWKSDPEVEGHMYGTTSAIAYGKLFSGDGSGGGGTLYCYDLKTGKLLWKYESESPGLKAYWPKYNIGVAFVADRKVYITGSEHSPGPILWPGNTLRCINADTGKELWRISCWAQGVTGADGYIVTLNAYDNQIYCFGKGQTSTTVTVQNDVVPKGSSILIKGAVSDLSPAVKGTPCVADEDMDAWMEYLVLQKQAPEKVKGVTVELYAIDENGNTISIGTATTDPLNGGIFKVLWTPPKEGTYTITAVFPGSKSYWDSYASTAIGVTAAAPQAPAPATPEQVQQATGEVSAQVTSLQETIQSMQTTQTVLVAIVVILLLLVAYQIYRNRKH